MLVLMLRTMPDTQRGPNKHMGSLSTACRSETIELSIPSILIFLQVWECSGIGQQVGEDLEMETLT